MYQFSQLYNLNGRQSSNTNLIFAPLIFCLVFSLLYEHWCCSHKLFKNGIRIVIAAINQLLARRRWQRTEGTEQMSRLAEVALCCLSTIFALIFHCLPVAKNRI